jgi:SAM-dependent methyltransferase
VVQVPLDAYRWLLGAEAQCWLQELAAAAHRPSVALIARLRKRLSAQHVGLLLEQIELRRRARAKFSAADAMYFTRRGLEQATDEQVAAYKALRFAPAWRVADLCCGIGGDTLGLARRSEVRAWDRDAIVLLLAEANSRCVLPGEDYAGANDPDPSCRTAFVCDDVMRCPLRDFDAWHIDPDRRPAGRRSTYVGCHEPGLAELQTLLQCCVHGAIKLAPAAEVPGPWEQTAELEWIGRGRQCRQLVAWFGNLARYPGRRAATVLGDHPPRTIVGLPWAEPPVAQRIHRYVYEPDPAVLAAGLTGELARQHELAALAPGVGYLTGDVRCHDAALTAFEVDEVLPFKLPLVKAALRARRIGLLEVKKRAVSCDTARLQHQLRGPGDKPATLIVAPHAGQTRAVLCRRVRVPMRDGGTTA